MRTDSRARNRRGEGSLLRAEILTGAARLLEDSGSPEAITLRAVARAVGISAPAIYAHFADREAILEAVIEAAFAEFTEALQDALRDVVDPLTRLRTGCDAYLQFARERPHRYRVLFELRPAPAVAELPTAADCVDGPDDTDAFQLLVDCLQSCVDAGVSASTDVFADATAIWVGLHGYATLRSGLPDFPWPSEEAVLDRLVYGLARTTVPTG